MAPTLLTADVGLGFVCFFGVAVVFVGLAILIGLVYLLNLFCDKVLKQKPVKKEAAAPSPVASNAEIPNREELVAAITAAIAEEEGKDISAIRVLSIKKI